MIILKILVFVGIIYYGSKLLIALGKVAMLPLCYLFSIFAALYIVGHAF